MSILTPSQAAAIASGVYSLRDEPLPLPVCPWTTR